VAAWAAAAYDLRLVTRRACVCAAAVLLAAAAGCKEKSKGGAGAQSVAAIEGMSAMPASIDAVLGADVPALARSELVERAVTRMFLGDPGLKKAIDQLFAGCGFRPERDLRTVLVGMDVDGAAVAGVERTLLVASGKLAEGTIAACVSKHMGEMGGALVETQVAGRTHYHADAPTGRQDVWFAFGSKDTVVVSSTAELLAEALGKTPRLADAPAMAALIERARRPAAALWAAGTLPPEVGKGLASASGGTLAPPREIFGSLVVEEGLNAEIGVELASPEEANSAVSLAKRQLELLAQVAQKWKLGQLVARVEASAAEKTLLLRLRLPDAELTQVLAPIDTPGPGQQTTAPLEDTVDPARERAGGKGAGDGERDAAPGGQAPVPEQGQAD
jgi:hypothetical protein